ncbi:hypothetical protein EBF03_07080 [Arcanobacterium haemolyticum]|uniref:hypothetical protein n=1 Tax=Arcanobacterium haemolyticum TaxID=28264 RepID=UPI001110B625|nr:hypothetical protein [Arcanobacterium haemolyticum]QCX47195.1 hypothetical protein EBF03_07080 [Arcanobacterium haemolyticum]
MIRGITGAFIGFLAAVLSLVAYSGPLDQPIIGLGLATGLIISGSWLTSRLTGLVGWILFCATLVITTGWFLFGANSGDYLYTDHSWALDAWLILLAVGVIVPVIGERFGRHELPPAEHRAEIVEEQAK